VVATRTNHDTCAPCARLSAPVSLGWPTAPASCCPSRRRVPPWWEWHRRLARNALAGSAPRRQSARTPPRQTPPAPRPTAPPAPPCATETKAAIEFLRAELRTSWARGSRRQHWQPLATAQSAVAHCGIDRHRVSTIDRHSRPPPMPVPMGRNGRWLPLSQAGLNTRSPAHTANLPRVDRARERHGQALAVYVCPNRKGLHRACDNDNDKDRHTSRAWQAYDTSWIALGTASQAPPHPITVLPPCVRACVRVCVRACLCACVRACGGGGRGH
jgi:hypothetical protein